MKEPWNEEWEVVRKNFGRGGNSTASLVVRRGGDTARYVLKVLRDQKNLLRRKRMYREAASLETIEHSGVVRLIQSNTGQWKEPSTDLYLILEYVDGLTLKQYLAKNGVMSLEEAVAMTVGILGGVGACHGAGIGHRDIKEDNVILRGGRPDRPVLIDFGLTFNLADDTSDTESEEQLGNRLLFLPELRVGNEKRDLRADLTSAAACLFYSFTGLKPGMLRDSQGLPPHERDGAKERLLELPHEQMAALTRFLGRAFRPRSADRWQTVADALAALMAVVRPGQSVTDGDALEAVKRAAEETRAVSDGMAADRAELAHAAADVLAERLDPQLRLIALGLESRQNRKMRLVVGVVVSSSRNWLSAASLHPGSSREKILLLRSDEPGVRTFSINMEGVFLPRSSGLPGDPEPPSDGVVPVQLKLEFHHTNGRSERQTYYYRTDGSLFTVPGGPVGDDAIFQKVFEWIDSPANWTDPL